MAGGRKRKGEGEARHKRFYSAEEDALIRKEYKAIGPGQDRNVSEELGRRLGRSGPSIRGRAFKLGLAPETTKRPKPKSEKLAMPVRGIPTGVREVEPGPPIPVAPRTRKLAAFDKAIARAVLECDLGLAPGALRYTGGAGHRG